MSVKCALHGGDELAVRKARVAAVAAGVQLQVGPAKAGAKPSVPELEVGGGSVSHTGAVLRCIGRVYDGSDLYGSSFIESAQVDSWLDWAEAELSTSAEENVDEVLAKLDGHLAQRTFLVGQRLTLADISVACSVEALPGGAVAPAAVKRWLGTCKAHPAFVGSGAGAAAAAVTTAPASGSSVVPAAGSVEGGIEAKYCKAVGGRCLIQKLLEGGEALIGQKVRVCGWIRRQTSFPAAAFLHVNDGSGPGTVQVVVERGGSFDNLEEFVKVDGQFKVGASINAVGTVVKSGGAGQVIEVKVDSAGHSIKLLGGVEDSASYPLAKRAPGLEKLREIGHLRPRTQIISSVARVRNALAFATHDFFRSRGFLYVHTPLITAADCEGAGEMFQVTTLMAEAEKNGLPKGKDGKIDYTKDFFGKPSYLTVSGQLSVENYCCALSNVYTFGPTFRAENSHTARHLSEFWMIEPELAFADILDDMDCAEDYLKYCVEYAMKHNRADIEVFEKEKPGLIQRLENLLAEPFKRLTYTDAIDVLIQNSKKAKFKEAVTWGMDLGSEHERYLAEKVYKKPVILYNYPKDIKAFYMRLNEDEKTVAAMDVLVPDIGEVIGGSQREERLEVLDRRITEMGLEPKDYWWYRDLRRYGTVPHSGFGLGFERLIMLTTGIENIRDVIPFPRYPGHAEF